MNQKTNLTSIRLNNRNSWAAIFAEDKRRFNKLFLTCVRLEVFSSTFFKFFSILTEKPLIRFFRCNFVYVQSNFITKIINNKKLSTSQGVLSYKKLAENYINLAPSIGLFRLFLHDSTRLCNKKRKISNFSKKVKHSKFSLNRVNPAELLGVYIGWQLESSSKYGNNFRTNFKKGVKKTIQSFFKNGTSDAISGVKIVCSGRWKKTKSGRKQVFVFSRGKLLAQSFSSFVDEASYTGKTKYGIFNLKISAAYNNS